MAVAEALAHIQRWWDRYKPGPGALFTAEQIRELLHDKAGLREDDHEHAGLTGEHVGFVLTESDRNFVVHWPGSTDPVHVRLYLARAIVALDAAGYRGSHELVQMHDRTMLVIRRP